MSGRTITVPLTIQIGEKKQVVGTATVTGNEVIAYISQHVHTVGEELTKMLEHNIIHGINLQVVVKPRVRQVLHKSDNFTMYKFVYPTEEQ